MHRKTGPPEERLGQWKKTLCEPVAFEINDGDRYAGNAAKFNEQSNDRLVFEVMQEEGAGDDIECVIGKRKVERVGSDRRLRGILQIAQLHV